MSTHEYKVWPEYAVAMMAGTKNFDVRKVDPERAQVSVGDLVKFSVYTRDRVSLGTCFTRRVIYVLSGGDFGLPEDVFIMGLGFDLYAARADAGAIKLLLRSLNLCLPAETELRREGYTGTADEMRNLIEDCTEYLLKTVTRA